MKLKSKLIMSGVALAACAATLTSTTYAWYTNNTSVSTNSVSGSTATSGSDLLLISADNTTWGTTCTPDIDGTALKPLTYNSETKALNTLNYSTGEIGTETTDQAGYDSFTLYFKLQSTTAAHLYVKSFTVTNTTGSLPSKSVIGDNWSLISGKTAATSYTVDMLRALKLKMEITPYTDPTGDVTASAGETTTTIYDISTLQTFGDSTDSIGTYSSYNAHSYLNSVMEKSWTIAPDYKDKNVYPTGTTVSDVSNWDLGVLPTAGTSDTLGSYYQVVFKFYLDGSNKACFDACQGQSFSVTASFSTESTNVLKIKEN